MKTFASSMRVATAAAGLLAFAAMPALAQQTVSSADGSAVGRMANPAAVRPTGEVTNAKSRLPMLTDLSQVPGFEKISQGYGTLNHPFTTKGAYSAAANGAPVFINPWRPAGKLYMQFGSSTFVCSASVVNKGILVTAAHCVHNYGQQAAGWADNVWFQPAKHGAGIGSRYGEWDALTWYIPTVYYNGTDVCTTTGVVCENDIAVVVMETGGSVARWAGRDIAQVVSRYGTYHKSIGYTSFQGMTAAQITQLGYPVAFDSGYKMIRTDSLGYQVAPNNVIIGSDQTGGSSGGPWIMNFGQDPASTSSAPSFNARNRVVATTSWGYVSSALKVQGASRFDNNAAFPAPGPSNFESLLNSACTAYPSKCF